MDQNNYTNKLHLHDYSVGDERRKELIDGIKKDSTFIPQSVTYRDIDEDFKRWVEEDLKITSDNGVEFPTMSLYSNQRFSEYAQTWKYTDKDNNILLNFKTVNRKNNPEYGNIIDKKYNIPGERFYLMQRKLVLDDNGTESIMDLKMKVPVSIDFMYKLSVFTQKYQLINDFNCMVNNRFQSRQCYIRPNGHYMPMTLEGISDESEYSIDDRQFYSQSYDIKVMGYVIGDDDYVVEEHPLKFGVKIGVDTDGVNASSVEIDDTNPDDITLTIDFPVGSTVSKFTIDTDFLCGVDKIDNILGNYRIFINDTLADKDSKMDIRDGDEIKIMVQKRFSDRKSSIILKGKRL